MTALLIGCEPEISLGLTYTAVPPYDEVMVGSLSIGDLLYFRCPEALTALMEGIPVYIWKPGMEHRQLGQQFSPRLYAQCLRAERELRDWGAYFISEAPKPPLITGAQAHALRRAGKPPYSGRMTPLAWDILGGNT